LEFKRPAGYFLAKLVRFVRRLGAVRAKIATCSILLAIAGGLQAASVIPNVGVNATSWWDDHLGAGSIQWIGNLTNNSGLSAPYDVTATHAFHRDAVDMWHAKAWSVDPNPTVTFTLGGTFDLTGIHIWNGNQALDTAHIRRGVNRFQLSVSKDGGTTYSPVGTYNLVVSPMPGTQVSAQNFDLTGQNGVTHVRLRVLSTHNSPAGGGDYASLAEVMFTAVLVPEVLTLNEFLVEPGKVTLAIPSTPGQVFDIFRTTNLGVGFGPPLAPGVPAASGSTAVESVVDDFSGGVTVVDTSVNFSSLLTAGVQYAFIRTNGDNAGKEVAVVSWSGSTITLAENVGADLSWSGPYRIGVPAPAETRWVDTDPPADRAFYKVERR
jgi:hypothetical protein